MLNNAEIIKTGMEIWYSFLSKQRKYAAKVSINLPNKKTMPAPKIPYSTKNI